MTTDRKSESSFQAENIGLRELLTQAGLDAARLLAQAGIDATENEAAKQLQQLLLEELHHRVKNTLATVIAITSQSLRNAESLEQGRIAVESRLFALGSAHDLLLEANWARAQLSNVIRAAIQPFDDSRSSRFSLREIDFDVDASAVLPLTMSLNELCTNAVKYGALSVPAGRIEITPSVDDEANRFNLSWKEMGGPIVQEPKRRGFGTRLIDRLADQLHGEARLKYDPHGIVYQLDLPLTALRKIAS